MKATLIIILFMVAFPLSAQEPADSARTVLSFNGQITGWEVTKFPEPVSWQTGGRFLPTLLGEYSWGENSKLSFEASAHINGSLNFSDWNYVDGYGEIKPYRVWLRYSGRNWELRGGLQKINFGVARMFRPLM